MTAGEASDGDYLEFCFFPGHVSGKGHPIQKMPQTDKTSGSAGGFVLKVELFRISASGPAEPDAAVLICHHVHRAVQQLGHVGPGQRVGHGLGAVVPAVDNA